MVLIIFIPSDDTWRRGGDSNASSLPPTPNVSAAGRYIPPSMRNKMAAAPPSDGGDRGDDRRGDDRGGNDRGGDGGWRGGGNQTFLTI